VEIWQFAAYENHNIPPQPNSLWFNVIFWRLPEAVPAIIELYVINSSKVKIQRDRLYIEGLYQESEDSFGDEAKDDETTVIFKSDALQHFASRASNWAWFHQDK